MYADPGAGHIGIRNFDMNKVKGHLFLLEKLRLIKKVSYGSKNYYIGQSDRSFIEYNLKNPPTDVQDRTRFNFLILDKLKTTDRQRFLAIKSTRRTETAESQ